MVLRFYPKKDATIYEYYPIRNTGLDAILDISKTTVDTDNYNSRILIDFDLQEIINKITTNNYANGSAAAFRYRLKLYVSEANEIPADYSLYCYAVSQSWNMGLGRFSNSPQTTTGVSWRYRLTEDDATTKWTTGSYNTNTTASWTTTAGGATWYTSSAASQSFSYTTSDVSMDITDVVLPYVNGTYSPSSFNGLIIKKSDSDESSTNIFNSLKFFSKDTHTIYLPVLEALYDASTQAGSLNTVNTTQDYSVIPVNLKPSYNETSTPIIRVSARPKYPEDTFATSSGYLTRYKLPASSSYAIYAANTDDVFLDFSDYTKVSSDAESSYFKLHLDSFQPERYYRLVLKVPYSGSTNLDEYNIHDEQWIFKVTRK